MKTKKWKKFLCAGLVLSMLLGLTACGKEETEKKDYSNAALAKEGVYREQPLEIPGTYNDMGVRLLTMVNDIIYAVCEVYIWDGTDNDQNLKLLSVNKDGSNLQTVDMQLYMDGVMPEVPVIEESEGENGDNAGAGEAVTLPMQPRNALILEEPVDSYYYYTSVSNLSFSEDSKIYGVKNYYYENYADPENYISINKNYVCCWDFSGTMLWETEINVEQSEDSWFYIQSAIALNDGVAVLIEGEKSELMKIGTDGVVIERTDLPAVAETLSTASIVSNDKGVITYVYWDMNGESKMWMNKIDFNTMTVEEPYQLPDSLFMSGYSSLTEGGSVADLVYTTSMGVFGVNFGDTESVQLMSFVNSDLATNNMNNILVLDENQMVGFYYDEYDNITKGSIFTKVPPEDIQDKAVMVLAAHYISYDLKKQAVAFNRESQDYRIVIKEYNSYSTYDDYLAGYTKLNNDILAEGMPDILVADVNMPIESYISKGWLADIDQLIAEDEELSQKEFMQNIFDAYRVGGKLYYVIPSYNIRTLIGKKSVVGDRTSWTMHDLMDLMATMPEGTQAMGEMTRGNFMYQMMQFCGSDFIDVETGKCAFDSDNFKSMLEYAKTLPEEFSEDYYGEDYWMTYESQYREDRTILMNCYIMSAQEMNRNINGSFGEEISYIGFPTDSGNGSVVMANQQYVLSSQSDNLSGAWEFIRYYLTDEYQNTLQYELSVDKAVFASKAQEAMQKPYYLNGEGEKVEYDDTFYINGESIILPQMTQEQVDQFVNFAQTVNKSTYDNQNIQNIINEEAEAYFSGQKSVDDVAAIIQSRAQIYVNENS